MRFESLFQPRSIAVIGASTTPGSVGNTLTENLLRHGYSGKIYPVNPKTDNIFDLPCFPTVADITDVIDLAIIIVPASIVPTVLRESGEKGIPAAIIISSGFKETGEQGKALEDEIIAIAHEFNMALLGPNCLGFLNPSLGLNASFAAQMPQDGSIVFFSQSGALCTALLDLSAGSLGFSCFASIGNKAVLGENDLLRYFAQDTRNETLAFYTENLSESSEIIQTGRAILRRAEPKPIIALKSGKTAAGTQASSSHTGALAGSDAAYDALFKQARILRAKNLEHLLHLLEIFSQNKLPRRNRIAIVTNAGGLGVLATDAAIAVGLELAELSGNSQEALRSFLPQAASVMNPIDVLGDAMADRYAKTINIVGNDPAADMLVVIATPQTMTQGKETAQAIADFKKATGKPVVAVFAGKGSFAEAFEVCRKNRIASIAYPEAAVEALGDLFRVARWREETGSTSFEFSDIRKEEARVIIDDAKKSGRTKLTEKECLEVLGSYGFPLLVSEVVTNREEAREAAQRIGKSVAIKIISPDIVHKSDAGGVILHVAPEHAGEAFDMLMQQVKAQMPEARLEGAIVVEMAEKGGKEIIMGLKKEPGLGTLVLAGLGGIFVETFQDSALRFAPLTQEDAHEMLSELKSYPILLGTRGQEGTDVATLRSMLGRLSQLALDFPEIEELDINPVLAFPDASRFKILDARMRLAQ